MADLREIPAYCNGEYTIKMVYKAEDIPMPGNNLKKNMISLTHKDCNNDWQTDSRTVFFGREISVSGVGSTNKENEPPPGIHFFHGWCLQQNISDKANHSSILRSSLEQCAKIKVCVLLEKSPFETQEELEKAYGNDSSTSGFLPVSMAENEIEGTSFRAGVLKKQN
ncbi:hypothetical protein TNCV_2879521 [Trichonephila clavipes]|uniref:Uncharacterized protein n=1 Tax=Trichonephila clavipes TaxID=2585209 RepID=A0A8X6W264_TRICX|nr:hypothetical protein TNCV_2879521 [Trichonephila clavipes]